MTLALISGLLVRVADGLALTVVGIAVVFLALTLLMLMIVGFNRILARGGAKAGAVSAAGAAVAADLPAVGDVAVSPQVVAVISAAVAAALGPGARVHRVRFVGPGERGQWAASGRAGIMGSHRPHLLHRGPRPRSG